MNVEEECVKCLEVVHKKVTWARLALENEHDPNLVSSYLKVITNGVEAINVLRKFST
jgi:predicted transcriptional regulator